MHAHGPKTSSKQPSLRRKLVVSAVATLLFVAVELLAGIFANALALIGDAIHNITDSVSLFLALFVVFIEVLPATNVKTFGYQRAGILVAFINASLLVAFTIFLIIEGLQRYANPEPVNSLAMIIVAAIGIALNIAITVWLRRESREDINIRAAVVHLFGDTLSSAGVIAAALMIRATGSYIWDPVVTFIIAAFIFWSAWDVLRETVNLLLEGTPRGIDPEEVARDLAAEEGVYGVHHLHIWAIAPTKPALSCHLMLGDVSLSTTGGILARTTAMLAEKYSIAHTTIQFEHAGCPVDDPHCIIDESAESKLIEATVQTR